jgi:hypothetical protein
LNRSRTPQKKTKKKQPEAKLTKQPKQKLNKKKQKKIKKIPSFHACSTPHSEKNLVNLIRENVAFFGDIFTG